MYAYSCIVQLCSVELKNVVDLLDAALTLFCILELVSNIDVYFIVVMFSKFLALPVDNPPPNTKTLPKLSEAQMVCLQAAKKYCLEATVRHVSHNNH